MDSNRPSGTVTFLFTDIQGSTHLWQEEPQAMTAAHARHDAILPKAIESNNGFIFQIVGNSFSAAFHNAVDGLRAALSAQRRLQLEPRGETGALRVRMGLHTGTAEMSDDGKYEGYATLASTQRVMSAAHGGQTLLTQTTYDLLQHVLPEGITLRDKNSCSFSITASISSSVAQICSRLDGIPLAIELAAARTMLLSADQIAARLDDLFRLLVGGSRTALPRQQTLRALIDWSYDLLSEEERQLLRTASVFVGGWTLDALETVSEDPNAIEHLEGLINTGFRGIVRPAITPDAITRGVDA